MGLRDFWENDVKPAWRENGVFIAMLLIAIVALVFAYSLHPEHQPVDPTKEVAP